MKLGVLTVPLQAMETEETFKYLSGLGVETIELGAGGYTNANHLNPTALMQDDKKIQELLDLTKKYNLSISGLSCHGNPVHPDADFAKKDHDVYEQTVILAKKLGVDTVITFSGCPGDHDGAKYPNWVTCSWPEDFGKVLDYQWNDVLIPYWKKAGEFAKNNGVKIAFEMHPGFCVYNTQSMLRIRKEVGDVLGANFDPSHLFWQGMDPVASIRELGDAIYHFHAKDTRIDKYNTAVNGVLDTGHYGNLNERSWVFCTVGYGHDESVWKDIIYNLRGVGYDGAISIEHEDAYMSPREGHEKAIKFLKGVIIDEQPGQIWWA